jgi:hypothetical protein
MESRVLRCSVAAASVLAILTLVSTSPAQNGAPAAKSSCVGCSVDGKTTPRTLDGHPDLDGFWNNAPGVGNNLSDRSADGSVLYDQGGNSLDGQGRTRGTQEVGLSFYDNLAQLSQPTYKPEYAAKVKAIMDGAYGVTTPLDPQMDCKPLGVPRGASGAMNIIQTPQVVAILYESSPGPVYRLIYTDGRPHPKDLDTSYMGHSIGSWQGDTLVVDVTGLNDETWLGGGLGGEKYALMHSEQEHVIERYTRNGDMLTYEATVEDPIMFVKPWVISPRHIRHAGPGDEIIEAICVPHDKPHFVRPTEEDPFICNYCTKATRTPGTGLATPTTNP